MSLFANYAPFKCELEKYVDHCKTIFDEVGEHALSSFTGGFMKDLENQRYNLTILGSLKRGKSTLLNALMERKDDSISPISSVVCTSAIIEYYDKALAPESNKEEHAVVYFDKEGQDPVTIPLQQLRDYVTEACNPENRKQVKSVSVYGDFPQWSKATTIVDSPGQNSVHSYHDTLLLEHLPFTDAIIFLVSADLPLDGGDIALLKELEASEKRKIFFVLTKTDTIENPEDLCEVVDHVKGKIQASGLSCSKLYTVAAKPVYDALMHGVTGEELESIKAKNGLAELEKDLERFVVVESKQTTFLRDRIAALFSQTTKACDNYITTTSEILSKETYDLTQLQEEEKGLKEKNKTLKENTERALKKFSREWSKALERFRRKTTFKPNEIADRIIARLDRKNLIGTVVASVKLKKQVQKATAAELNSLVCDLQDELEGVAKTLSEEYDGEISLYLKRKAGVDFATLGGTAVAAGALGYLGYSAYSAISPAWASVKTALNALSSATVAEAAAKAKDSFAYQGLIHTIEDFFVANDAAKEAVEAGIEVSRAGTTAITTGVEALVTTALWGIGLYVAKKVVHAVLVEFQSGRVDALAETAVSEMIKTLFESLKTYKNEIVKEYTKNIENVIKDGEERLAKIRGIISSDDPRKREELAAQLEKVKALRDDGFAVQKKIPLLLGEAKA